MFSSKLRTYMWGTLIIMWPQLSLCLKCSVKRFRRERVSVILASEEFSVLDSPTKRVIRYKYAEGYPRADVTLLCQIAGATESRYYDKKHRLDNGYPYDGHGRLPILNEEESKQLEQYVAKAIVWMSLCFLYQNKTYSIRYVQRLEHHYQDYLTNYERL